jgi:hypothetical protein
MDLGSLVTVHNRLWERIKEYENFFKIFFPKENQGDVTIK